jgi:hypothetical protein
VASPTGHNEKYASGAIGAVVSSAILRRYASADICFSTGHAAREE